MDLDMKHLSLKVKEVKLQSLGTPIAETLQKRHLHKGILSESTSENLSLEEPRKKDS